MTRSVIVTGASSGIGRAVAEMFLDAGWQVGLLARRRSPLEDVAKGRTRAHVLVADVTDPQGVADAFDDFVTKTGHLDVLFNNAGMFGPSGPIDEVSLEEWNSVLGVNLNGMFIVARAAFGQMRAQSPMGGRIINNGSISAHTPREGSVCYTVTKHAITGLTKTLSLDGRPFDIACGQIDIGNAHTDMIDDLIARTKSADPAADLPKTMDVKHAANAVIHMADLPLSANVQFMTVMATKMPYIGRG